MKTACTIIFAIVGAVALAGGASATEQWAVWETTFTSAKTYEKPFVDVEVDVVFKQGEQQWKVPAFWSGGDTWTVRFAPPVPGNFTYRVQCSDPENAGLNGHEQSLRVTACTGDNPFLKHGFVRASANGRHFEHADGTPFFWLGDTWWKCLCKRMTWEGFKELTADRKAKGFNVVQIVCGPYPEPMARRASGTPAWKATLAAHPQRLAAARSMTGRRGKRE